MKKIFIPMLVSSILLGACGENKDVLVESKIGKITQNDIYKSIDNTEISQKTFQIVLLEIMKDKYKGKVKEKDILKTINDDVENYGSPEKFSLAMKKQRDIDTNPTKYKFDSIFAAYQEVMLNDKMPISDNEFKKNARNASHIMFPAKLDKAKLYATQTLKKLDENPKYFEGLAQEFSGDPGSASNGGKLGYVYKGQLDKKFENVLFSLKDKEYSKVIETDFGFHIVKNNGMSDFKKNKDSLKSEYRQYKISKDPNLLKKTYKKLLSEYDVKFKDKDIENNVNNFILKMTKPEK